MDTMLKNEDRENRRRNAGGVIMRERDASPWTALLGVMPLLAGALTVAVGHYPYPDNNLDGRKYLAYMLPRHVAEVQAIAWSVAVLAISAFFVLLARAHARARGRMGLPEIVMTVGAAMFGGLQLVVTGLYAGAALFARGYPAFGSTPSDLRQISFMWVSLNSLYVVSLLPLASVWIAVVYANRAHPVLPRALGGWMAVVVAVVNTANIATLFITTGKWSAGCVIPFTIHAAATFLWTAAAGFVLWRRARTPSGPGRDRPRTLVSSAADFEDS
ncbi:hypothetical protein [Kitasatospora brasiliensis]|uniref:hypothetical protein n=1 Tax=Kitasatospora brasiliensis TaxID=3058040 RepID=UPI002930ABF1|nr:hypothetical protein [Kitasatospora sp. K002]